ncbi:MAG: DNA-3-methyladenine glycosylase family protein, partial [Terriglobia bacterium]
MIFKVKRHPRTESLLEQAVRELSQSDRAMDKLIRRVGTCELPMKRRGHYFPALVEAIIYQQLSGKAAARILERFRALFPSRRFPTAEQVARTPDARLRSAGLSPQKISYVKDLARRTADGSFPLRRISMMDDAEVTRRLTEIKGIGPWTAEMFLIFTLGRPDVLPVTDLGIRKAVQRLYG